MLVLWVLAELYGVVTSKIVSCHYSVTKLIWNFCHHFQLLYSSVCVSFILPFALCDFKKNLMWSVKYVAEKLTLKVLFSLKTCFPGYLHNCDKYLKKKKNLWRLASDLFDSHSLTLFNFVIYVLKFPLCFKCGLKVKKICMTTF